MYLYKYFAEESKMTRFLSGEITFKSLLNYKLMEDKEEVSDKLEGEVSINPPPDLNVVTIGGHTIAPSDVASLKVFTGKEFTQNYLIFCVSTCPPAQFPIKDYSYFAKFDLDDFSSRIENIFLRGHHYYKNLHNIDGDVYPIPDKSKQAIHLPFNQKLEHGLVSYYEDGDISSLSLNPLFAKNKRYSNQAEYRFGFFIDYCQYNKTDGAIHAKTEIIDDNVVQAIKGLKINLQLGKICSSEFGKLKS